MSLTHSSPPKRLVVHERQKHKRNETLQRLSMGNWFNTVAGIPQKLGAEQRNDLSHYTESQCLKGSYDAILSFPFSLECYKLFSL